MRSNGVFVSAALLSLAVLTTGCTGGKSPTTTPPPTQTPPTNTPPFPTAPTATPIDVINPILSGDYADPSVVRVGDTYWASATSSEWAPQFPLMRSTDLQHWEQVGAIFQAPPAWSEQNYWAPELVVDKGRNFVVYTARKKVPEGPGKGPLCVAVATASQVQGPYTDRGPLVCQPLGSIDGAMIRDENDKLFLIWKEDGNSQSLPTNIWAQQLSEDGTQLLADKTSLILNDTPWEGQLVEGPHIIRRGGWFYLFYAGSGCCGVDCNYGIGVARSQKLLSGWEKNPLNPIARNNLSFRCPGHGSVVTDTQGVDYFLYHAYRATDSVYVGRQGMLDPIQWGTDGWPSINSRHGPGGTVLSKTVAFADEFTATALVTGWQWPNARQPTLSLSGGELTLAPSAALATDRLGAIVARSTNTGNYVAEAILDEAGVTPGTSAGLAAVGDPDNTLGITFNPDTAKVTVTRRQGTKDTDAGSLDAPTVSDGKLHLRMTVQDGHLYHFAVSADGTSWTDVGGEQNGDFLPPWDRGVRVGLTAGGASGAAARFESLHMTPQ